MKLNSLMAIAALAVLALSGCASTTGAGNTTYAQYQGFRPDPILSAADTGGVRVPY